MKTTEYTINRAKNVITNANELLQRASTTNHKCVTLWADLLGFSNHLSPALSGFSEETITENLGLRRIAAFHEISVQSMNDISDIVQLNDATIFSHDLNPQDPDTILSEFLARIDAFWEIANIVDKEMGGHGIRGVISIGNRYNLRANFGWTPTNKKAERPNFISPTPIMMNLPFAKSYYMESAKLLRKEPSLYIESRIFSEYKIAIMETWQFHETVLSETIGEYILVRFAGEK